MPECCETGRLEGDHIGGGWGCSKTGIIYYTFLFVCVSVLTIAQLCKVLMPYVWKTCLFAIICSSWLVLGPMFINTILAIVVNMKPELKWFVSRAFDGLIQGYVR